MTSLAFDFALAKSVPRIGVFFRLGINPPWRIWLGVGDCDAGIDAEDGAGETYNGYGELLNVPAFSQLLNGAADRVSFTLAGISDRVAQMASNESEDVKGVILKVGIGVFDDDWQIIDSPIWIRTFVVDYLSIDRQMNEKDASVWTVSLAARSFFTGRRRPGHSYFTDADQQARHSGDRFCDRAAIYTVEVVKLNPIRE